MKLLNCPHCNKPGISRIDKVFLGLMMSVNCRTCKRKVSIDSIKVLILLTIVVFAFSLTPILGLLLIPLFIITHNKWIPLIRQSDTRKTLSVILLIVLIPLIFLLSHFIKNNIIGLKTYKIASDSMAPTLNKGDIVIVDLKYYRNNELAKGDIVMYEKKTEEYGKTFKQKWLHRITAINGDIIQSKDKIIFINARQLNEPYVKFIDDNILGERDNFGPTQIEDGKVFLMGDNRDRSYDSRFTGLIEESAIFGKAVYLFISSDGKKAFEEIK